MEKMGSMNLNGDKDYCLTGNALCAFVTAA